MKSLGKAGQFKSEALFEELERRVAKLAPGSRFPSLRELMREYGVSQLTVERAKERLVKAGLLLQPSGRSACVAEPRGTALRGGRALKRLLFASPAWESPFFNLLAAELRAALPPGASMDSFKFHSLSEAQALAQAKSHDAIALVPGSGRCSLKVLDGIASSGVPCVFIDRSFEEIDVDCATLDSSGAGALAAKRLLSLGHRRLAVVVSEPPLPAITERVESFRNCVEAAGGAVATIACGTKPGDSGVALAHERMRELLKGSSFKATGVFIDSDPSAPGVMKALLDKGVSIPGDLSVLSCSGVPEAAFYFPALSSVSFDYAGLARFVVESVSARLEGSVPRSESLSFKAAPRLVLRESCGPVRVEKRK